LILERRVRAFNPFPGAASALGGETVKVWAARAEGPAGPGAGPGQVLSAEPDGIRVSTGEGTLVLTELQRGGGKRLPVADFLRGFVITPGQVFDAAVAGGA
jgi:methionyl-tRNA formyltransferase